MTGSEWDYLKRMAKEHNVTLQEAGVTRTMRLGRAIDCVLDVAAKRG